jgi:restriction system protein
MLEVLDVDNTTLDEWLALLRHPPKGKVFVRNMFPTDAHRTEWFRTSGARVDADIKLLLRNFLVPTGSNLMDQIRVQHLRTRLRAEETPNLDNLLERERRLLHFWQTKGRFPVWEGIQWILDLLPGHPRVALNVIDAFFTAHWDTMHDHYLSGLFDAEAIIRRRYIESAHTTDPATRALLGLDWRELEWLCGALYNSMGYDITVTPRGDDDGVDVFARNPEPGRTDLTVIQAKKWSHKNPVGKAEVRELLGAVVFHQATKGVLVTSGRFEKGAIEMPKTDPRLELLDQQALLPLLNEHCGADWYTNVDRVLRFAKLEVSDTD